MIYPIGPMNGSMKLLVLYTYKPTCMYFRGTAILQKVTEGGDEVFVTNFVYRNYSDFMDLLYSKFVFVHIDN